jgi:hypothetical protein
MPDLPDRNTFELFPPNIRSLVHQLLGHSSDDDPGGRTVERILSAATRITRYCTAALADDLHRFLGYSESYAATTASQIMLKPVLYSLLVRVRNGDLAAIADGGITDEDLRSWYHELAPEVTAYLFDQTIDDFNVGIREQTAVQRLIDQAGVLLPSRPTLYQEHLNTVLDRITKGVPAHRICEVPESRPFLLIARYIEHCLSGGAAAADVADLLHTVSDMLATGHLAVISFRDRSGQHRYRRYHTFVEAQFTSRQCWDDRHEQLTRSLVHNVGMVGVAVSHYLLRGVREHSLPPRRPARQILRTTPGLADLTTLQNLVVRIGDDLADLTIDETTDVPNVYLLEIPTRRRLASACGIGDGQIDRVAEQRVIELLCTENPGEDLLHAVYRLLCIAETNLNESGPIAPDAAELATHFASVLSGSLVNAQLDDRHIAEIAQQINKYGCGSLGGTCSAGL